LAAPPGTKKLMSMITPPTQTPKNFSVHLREGHVRRADLQRHDEISKRANANGTTPRKS
jgi:hypothetical protein